jgi:predicted transglutaminase-like cysteine proteinase
VARAQDGSVAGLIAVAGVILGLAVPRPAAADIAVPGPVGWQAMCRATPTYCNHSPSVAGPTLTRAQADLLRAVNRSVNRSIRATTAASGLDAWQIAPEEGDCVDYALTKKHRLLRHGWPAGTLRFASVLTEQGEPHAILLVETATGPLALDNRRDAVLPWADLAARGYLLLAVEGQGPRGTWRATPAAAFAALALSGRRPGL